MAFQANDGSQHTNMSTMKSANASHMAKAPMAADPNPDAGGDILQSPEVQQMFQSLAAAGVSPDELMQAYSQVSGDAQPDMSQGAPAA